jgi:hypothetical protein
MNKLVLESARGVKGGKVQLAFSQVIKTATSSANVLGLLNEDDDRFNQQKPRYAWLSGTPASIEKQFGIDVSSLGEGDVLEIGQVDPKLAGFPEETLNIQITETTEGSEWQVANFDRAAKRAGKDGDFIMKDDMYIYVNSTVVTGEANHTILSDTTRKAPSASSAIDAALNG